MKLTTKTKGYLLSLLIVLATLGVWQWATLLQKVYAPTDPLKLEYSVLMGDIPEFT